MRWDDREVDADVNEVERAVTRDKETTDRFVEADRGQDSFALEMGGAVEKHRNTSRALGLLLWAMKLNALELNIIVVSMLLGSELVW